MQWCVVLELSGTRQSFGHKLRVSGVAPRMAATPADTQHLDWLARSFGRPEYSPLFPGDLETLDRVARRLTKLPGSHLFREGQVADAAFVVVSGEVELYRGSGSSQRVVSRVRSGGVIGDIAVFSGEPYVSSARAAGPVELLKFEKQPLLAELARHPAICLRWLAAGLRQLERTQHRVIRLLHRTVDGRLADLLLESDGPTELSQSTIASLLGISRQSVNESVATLRAKGLIETGYRSIQVLDRPGLQQVADGD